MIQQDVSQTRYEVRHILCVLCDQNSCKSNVQNAGFGRHETSSTWYLTGGGVRGPKSIVGTGETMVTRHHEVTLGSKTRKTK